MKHVIQILILCLSIIGASEALGDNAENSPYDNVQTGKLDKNKAMLSIKIKANSEKATSSKEKVLIKLYNNTEGNIYVLEQQQFVDFTFEVKDATGAVIAPNSELEKPKQNRDAWLHVPRKLEPGQFTTYTINLSKIYDLQAGQAYTVQVSRYINTQEFGSGTKISSNVLSFTVSQ